MHDARDGSIKEEVAAIAAKYGIEVVGFLELDGRARMPADEASLLEGVRWEDGEVDTSNIRDPADIMPSAKAMIILGKRLFDDRADIYYRASEGYSASVEMMLLEIAASRIVGALESRGAGAANYTSYYLKAFAVLAGLGWIGKSRMFVSKAHGPRLRLRGILTDADVGERHAVLPDTSCGACTDCMRACPVGAIREDDVDRKKCGACPLNHRRLTESARAYCTACTESCPVGRRPRRRQSTPG